MSEGLLTKNERTTSLTVLSYNIHKGRSYLSFRRFWPKLQSFLFSFETDLIFLQEFFREPAAEKLLEDAANRLWPHYSFGKNAVVGPFQYGNAILSKVPILETENLDLSTNKFERRGLLYAQIETAHFGKIHLACTHLNLTHKGREKQLKKINEFIKAKVPNDEALILAGDFNDWNNRLHPKIMNGMNLHSALTTKSGQLMATFPSVYPFFALDRIYLRHLNVHENKIIIDQNLIYQSDHLPVMVSIVPG